MPVTIQIPGLEPLTRLVGDELVNPGGGCLIPKGEFNLFVGELKSKRVRHDGVSLGSGAMWSKSKRLRPVLNPASRGTKILVTAIKSSGQDELKAATASGAVACLETMQLAVDQATKTQLDPCSI